MSNLLSIHETAARAKAEGLPLSEKAIRKFVKSGELPAVQTGKKALIFFPNVIEFVKSGNNQQEQTEQIGKIRPLRV